MSRRIVEYGEQALAATLYHRPGLMLLPGVQAAAAPGGGGGRGGGGVWPALLCWAAVQVAAQGGCPPHEQATQLVRLGMEEHDAALLRAVLGCTALRPYLCDNVWLAQTLRYAAIARDPGEGVLRALLGAGVGAAPEHQAARDEALRWAVTVEKVGAARLLLAAGADAGDLLEYAVEGSWDDQLRLLADLGVRFAAHDNGSLLRRAARWSRPAAVSELLRRDVWEREQVRAALRVAKAHHRAEVAELLQDALTALTTVAAHAGHCGMEPGPAAAAAPLGGGATGQPELREGALRATDGALGGGKGARAAPPGAESKGLPALRAMLVAGLVLGVVARGGLLCWRVKRNMSRPRPAPHRS
ncbi:hypothetical protein TSOC_004766 [Tetrabaena socialis]|uniref:Ankyrin repeat domain-containing protein n=1 Tax=Tetrabaena socialis TaxID=47790 RepID=A0A2J8A856_9CHLO|nr:hypothetical protein TSOC_004766 [Tetrabaena socialis]|eukprot:PNH08653.1 hypothetical protein TSOC_004766 [Tetrabaena socialis]